MKKIPKRGQLFTAALFLTFLTLLLMMSSGLSAAQVNTPTPLAGTLVRPTLVPVTPPTPTPAAAARSGIATLQEEGVFRVGSLYNVQPFAWLTETGEVIGYEPEVLRAIGVDLGVEVQFVQVTAETQFQMLLSGEVDALIGQQLRTRDAEAFFEFSYTYYYNEQRMVMREGTPYNRLSDFANQRVSVVAGSRGEQALNFWIAQNGVTLNIVRYLSQDAALDALANGEVEGMVGEYDDLTRAGRQQMSFIGEYISQEPYAIVFRRYDVNLRNAVNRALQRLFASGRMQEIAANWFAGQEINFAAFIPVYLNLYDDQRGITDFPPDVPVPARSVLDKIRAGEPLVVAGLSLSETDPSYFRFLDPLNRAIMEEMARRWGVTVTFLPATYNQGQDMIVQGTADVAVGVRPRWDGADRVDYSLPYHHRRDQIATIEGSRYAALGDFRGGSVIGYFQDEPEREERLEAIKEELGLNFTTFRFPNNQRVREEMYGVDTRNVDGLFADSIRLQALIAQYPNVPFRIIPPDFSFEPIVIAVPRNDADFLSLVNWTLGDMYWDGTLKRLWDEHYGWGDPPWIPRWIGEGAFLLQR